MKCPYCKGTGENPHPAKVKNPFLICPICCGAKEVTQKKIDELKWIIEEASK